jgi:hypothetical protein
MKGEFSPEIEERDLTNLSSDAHGADQKKSEIAFADGLVMGLGLSNKHAPGITKI